MGGEQFLGIIKIWRQQAAAHVLSIFTSGPPTEITSERMYSLVKRYMISLDDLRSFLTALGYHQDQDMSAQALVTIGQMLGYERPIVRLDKGPDMCPVVCFMGNADGSLAPAGIVHDDHCKDSAIYCLEPTSSSEEDSSPRDYLGTTEPFPDETTSPWSFSESIYTTHGPEDEEEHLEVGYPGYNAGELPQFSTPDLILTPDDIKLGKNLTHDQRAALRRLLWDNEDVFAFTPEQLGRSDIVTFRVKLKEGAQPVALPYHRTPFK
jgi:hypothetical protein